MIDNDEMELIQKHVQRIDHLLQENDVVNDYGFESLRWLEGFVDRRGQISKPHEYILIDMISAFFGECLCRAYKGQWVEDEDQGFGVLMDNTLTARPFNKVAKYFADPSVNSFAGMFRSTPALIQHIKEKQVSPKPDDRMSE